MSEYTLQANFKVGNHLINVIGLDQHAFQENLKWVTENAAGIVATGVALEAAYSLPSLAGNVASVQVQQQPQQHYQQAAAAPQQQYQPQQPPQGAAPGPSCVHGPMRLKAAGISKAGNSYNAFYSCTGPRESQCKTVNA